MEVSTFSEKKNKLDGIVYVVEETVTLTNGVYEAELQHDNINADTLTVYTGPKLTGERITDFALSTPSNTPWKRLIRIYADTPLVYITYETPGDTVEADDINRVQNAVIRTQEAVNEETARAQAQESELREALRENKPVWDDKYTKNEVDNKFSALETAIDWKEAVDTFSDLADVYPDPKDGWTVNVKDTDYTYRWSGSKWVAISANAIPKATQAVDGLLTAADKRLYDDANSKKHSHSNKSVLDVITKAQMDKLDGIAAGAQVNVQADWNVTDSAAASYIKNKPIKIVPYGICQTAAAVAAKEVACPGFVLKTGASIKVKFTLTNTVANMTLNVNKTGAKPMKYHGGVLSNGYLSAKRILEFVYDGTNWEVVGDLDTNTKYVAFKGATATVAGTLGLVPAPASGKQDFFLCADGTWKEQKTVGDNFVIKAPTWDELMGRA